MYLLGGDTLSWISSYLFYCEHKRKMSAPQVKIWEANNARRLFFHIPFLFLLICNMNPLCIIEVYIVSLKLWRHYILNMFFSLLWIFFWAHIYFVSQVYPTFCHPLVFQASLKIQVKSFRLNQPHFSSKVLQNYNILLQKLS